jgi:hypothetical protein
MAKIATLHGTFDRNGSKIFTRSGYLLIAQRPPSKISKAKTAEYLLHVDPNGQRRYVSSLWEQAPDTYELEYARRRYRMTLTPTTAEIVDLTTDGANRIVYHKRLVTEIDTTT